MTTRPSRSQQYDNRHLTQLSKPIVLQKGTVHRISLVCSCECRLRDNAHVSGHGTRQAPKATAQTPAALNTVCLMLLFSVWGCSGAWPEVFWEGSVDSTLAWQLCPKLKTKARRKYRISEDGTKKAWQFACGPAYTAARFSASSAIHAKYVPLLNWEESLNKFCYNRTGIKIKSRNTIYKFTADFYF